MSKKCPEKPKNGFPELDSDMKYSLNSARQPLPHYIQEKQKHFWHSSANDRYEVNKNMRKYPHLEDKKSTLTPR